MRYIKRYWDIIFPSISILLFAVFSGMNLGAAYMAYDKKDYFIAVLAPIGTIGILYMIYVCTYLLAFELFKETTKPAINVTVSNKKKNRFKRKGK